MKFVEIKIQVPWGYIAGKMWGNHTDPITIMVHGAMDNAGSFDRLVPLLPNSFCYICIDLPGHGKSSHFPLFFPIHLVNYVIALKLVVQHFDKKKYIIVGHSYGAHIALWFTQLYPQYVEKLVIFDIIRFHPVNVEKFSEHLRKKIDYCITLHRKKGIEKRPVYTYTEALHKLKNQRFSGLVLTNEAAEALLQRAVTIAKDGKCTFRHDPRIKVLLTHDLSYTQEILKEFSSTCSVLLLIAKDPVSLERFKKPLDAVFNEKKNFCLINMEGNHDVHNNNPEIVAPYVADFLLKMSGKL